MMIYNSVELLKHRGSRVDIRYLTPFNLIDMEGRL